MLGKTVAERGFECQSTQEEATRAIPEQDATAQDADAQTTGPRIIRSWNLRRGKGMITDIPPDHLRSDEGKGLVGVFGIQYWPARTGPFA